jgi:hypothetical protein
VKGIEPPVARVASVGTAANFNHLFVMKLTMKVYDEAQLSRSTDIY